MAWSLVRGQWLAEYPWDPVPFNTFIIDLDAGADHSLSKRGLMAQTGRSCWYTRAVPWSRRTSTGYRNVLPETSWNSKRGSAKSCTWEDQSQSLLVCSGITWLESSLADKDLGALVKPKLSMTKKTNAWAALQSVTSRSSELSSPLLSTGETAFGAFGPVLIFLAQERHGHAEECPAKGH